MARLKHLLEYSALRVVHVGVLLMPHRCALLWAWCLAWLSFHLVRLGRAEAVRRIGVVFGDTMTPRQRRRIAWISWRNIFFNAVEMMRVTRLSPAWMARHTWGMDTAIGEAQRLIAAYGGVVVAVAHTGNWDLAGVACRQAGIDIFSIAGKQKNPYFNRWLDHLRSHSMDVLERGSSVLRVVLRRLQKGGAFAILPDVRMRTPDLTITFLGAQANLGRGMAQFARSANVPILPVILVREGWHKHRVAFHKPVLPNRQAEREADLTRLTQEVIDHIDAAIRAHPEQWFWYNRRWVLQPLKKRPPTAEAATPDS